MENDAYFYLLALLPLLYLIRLYRASFGPHNHGLRLPPGPWQLPVIGSLHHLFGALPHRALRDLSQRHGPLMLLKFGENPVIIASSAEAAKEIMKVHDSIFCTRPLSSSVKVMNELGRGIAFAPYGDHWRQMRKICFLELLSTKRISSFQAIREEEATRLIRSVSSASQLEVVVNLGKMLAMYVTDTTVHAIMGGRFKEQDTLLHYVDEAVRLVGGFSLPDLFPSSRLALALRKRTQDLFAGGSETATTTLQWAMAELMRNPSVMSRAQAEVRAAFMGQMKVSEEGLGELSYLQCIIKETLRLHTPGPLLMPRECQEHCKILGYDVPKGTTVLVNAWAISRDPECWDEPEAFMPERFMSSVRDYKGNNFEFIPFGAGRRICPGMLFGIANIELALASLLFYFDWSLPDGILPSELDMTEAFGVTARKKVDLLLRPTAHVQLPR
uniref:Cytochrome P450 71D7 n=1 Tax=Aegilops tauschii subsp. strangulata TaxID=200361 RepID=A0A453TAD6_AEGTS